MTRVAVVLGAKVYPDGRLSLLLSDRVNKAVALYKAGKVEKILMSGDNRFAHYDEPTRMAEYAIRKGVDPDDVAMDFAGRRTYDSVYRAKHIFGLDGCIIVSQGFHLDRAIFLCRKLGIDGYGVAADEHMYMGGRVRFARIREIPACLSALADVYLLHPRPVMGRRERI
ncbi:MAG: SanA/YdcF family protein [Armatimonadota bacterium]